MKRKVERIFDFKCSNFMICEATVPSQCSVRNIKKHFVTFDFFCKNEACVNCETYKRH